jgi:hypothetical protein
VDLQENGRTSTRILSDDQLADYGPWFDKHRRLRELIAELEDYSLDIAEADPLEPLTRPPGTGRSGRPPKPEPRPPQNVGSTAFPVGRPHMPRSALNVKISPARRH